MSQHRNQQVPQHSSPTAPDSKDTKLQRLLQQIDPPGNEVTDEELNNPGAMTPQSPPVDNRS